MKYYYYIFILLFKIRNIQAGCYSGWRLDEGLQLLEFGKGQRRDLMLERGFTDQSKLGWVFRLVCCVYLLHPTIPTRDINYLLYHTLYYFEYALFLFSLGLILNFGSLF